MSLSTCSRPRSRFASRVVLTLGAVGIASVASKLALEAVRTSDECPSPFTVAFEWLVGAVILASAPALIVGVFALIVRAEGTTSTVVGIGFAIAATILMFTPNVMTVTCGAA